MTVAHGRLDGRRRPAALAPVLAGLAAVAASLVVPTAAADSAVFGGLGVPVYREYAGPGGLTAPEPTIGIPWDTDHVFYHTSSTTHRITFDAGQNATWTDVTAPYQLPINVDPMLVADEDTGRIWAGGLHGPCSIMLYSDDDGASWLPTVNMCSGLDFDHQSLGSGPSNSPLAGILYPHAQYYCGQSGTISCATSYDGGVTWGPFVQELTVCEGFHGHIRVSRVSGMMAVPVGDCGGELGMLTTEDGLTFAAKTIPGSEAWTNGFDPSLQFGRGDGWLWYGMASEHGIHISLSKDDGDTWVPLAADGTASLDLGTFHDPPVIAGTFADVQVGDDDRVAMSFLGLEGGPGVDEEFLRSDRIFQCDERQDALVWHYYIAMSHDGGANWTVTRISDDPVQVGGMYDVVVDGSGACRNLLDFNDMDIDSTGRVHIAWADGCVRQCAETEEPETDGWREREARLFRQVTGKGLFAAYDGDPATTDSDGDGVPDAEEGQAGTDPADAGSRPDPEFLQQPFQDDDGFLGIPGPGVAFVALAFAVAFYARRRR